MNKMFLFLSLIFLSEKGVSDRLLGARVAKINEFPFMAEIRNSDGSHVCGGIIVTNRIVITAAHCFSESAAEYFKAIVGANGIKNKQVAVSRQVIKFSNVTTHPLFKSTTYLHDIAIVWLTNSIVMSENAKTAPVGIKKPKPGTKCATVRWGVNNNIPTTFLLASSISILPDIACERAHRHFGYNPFYMICAGDISGRNDSSADDSGGPLLCGDLVVGLLACSLEYSKNSPGVYTSLGSHRTWILRETGEPCFKYKSPHLCSGDFGHGQFSKEIVILFVLILIWNVNNYYSKYCLQC